LNQKAQEPSRPPVERSETFTSLVPYTVDCGISKKVCRNPKTFHGWDVNGNHLHVIEQFCEAWSCPKCGRRKIAALMAKCQRADPNRFVTLTCWPSGDETPRQVYDYTRRQIAELIKVMRKSIGEVEYCRVLETHESGFPHYHLIVRSGWMDQAELSRHWVRLTNSMIVDIRKIKGKREIARYLVKYIRKQDSVPFTSRRITFSKNFDPGEEPREKSDFCFVDARTERGTIEEVVAWNYPDKTWTVKTDNHWIA